MRSPIEEVEASDTQSRLQRLAAFEAIPDAGKKEEPELENDNGIHFVAPPSQSRTESQFEELAYRGWVLDGFDWPNWIVTERGRLLMRSRAAIADASEHELAQVITCLVRSSRFGEDLLVRSLSNGLVLALVERARVLSASRHDGSPIL